MNELLEALGYLVGFWWFLFSQDFRAKVIREWRDRPLFLQLLIPLEVASATAVGLAPLLLIWWAVQR